MCLCVRVPDAFRPHLLRVWRCSPPAPRCHPSGRPAVLVAVRCQPAPPAAAAVAVWPRTVRVTERKRSRCRHRRLVQWAPWLSNQHAHREATMSSRRTADRIVSVHSPSVRQCSTSDSSGSPRHSTRVFHPVHPPTHCHCCVSSRTRCGAECESKRVESNRIESICRRCCEGLDGRSDWGGGVAIGSDGGWPFVCRAAAAFHSHEEEEQSTMHTCMKVRWLRRRKEQDSERIGRSGLKRERRNAATAAAPRK